jgi:hypothetical protein
MAAMLFAGALMACSHTEPPGVGDQAPEGPFSTNSPVQLTFNGGDDAFPVFSRDGNSIAYSYAAPARPDRDRCVGIIPAAGGTRSFSLCETRIVFADSTDVMTPLGLAPDGRLLYAHSTTTRFAQTPGSTRIYLTDTLGAPAIRLATLPTPVAAGAVTWLANAHWVSDGEFLALGQQMTVVPRCHDCGATRDTLFDPVAVVRATITSQGMTLASIAGTDGALGFGTNAAGTEILIARGMELLRVPGSGGTAVPVAALPAGFTFVDIDCGGDVCGLLLSQFPGPFNRTARIGNAIYSIPFAGGALTSRASSLVYRWWGVRVSPSGGEMILTIGGTEPRDLFALTNLF